MPPVKEKDSPDGEPRQRKRPGRVPVSCAECRRLKLRCDRKVPCETCMKRGCAALCPDGQLITGGKGTRQAVADVEELKKKIEQLKKRSATLEDALRSIQAAVSDEPHPLLREGENGSSSSSANSPASQTNGSPIEGPSLSADEEEVLDAFGTLTLGLRGETRFFGQTSRSEYLIHAPERLSVNEVPLPRLSKAMVDEANKELDVPLVSCPIAMELMTYLPPLSQACQLCETFLEFGKFAWYPLPRKYIFDDILSVVYHSPKESGSCNVATLHSMSLLWMIYALATLFDPNTPPYAVEAYEYYLLARVSLRFAPPAHDTTLTAIQTMIYMTQYLELSDCEPAHTGSHKAWMQIGQAVKLGHSIGLHVSSTRWRLGEDAALKRNQVFWQLFSQDIWLSFGFGRPPSINLDFVDCEIPKTPEPACKEVDEREAGYHIWTWQYTKLLYSVITTAFAAKQPGYAKVLELDRKVRDHPVPASLRVQCGSPEECASTTALNMQRLQATLSKETTLLNLHRPYFSQALNDMPEDPLKHKYGPSVMAIYRSAWRIFASTRCAYKAVPNIASRMGIIWSLALSGSIVMCLLVTRAPSSNLAQSSLAELDKLTDLFEEAASQSQIASNNVEVMRKLRKQAHDAMSQAHGSDESERIHSELDRYGGKTHLIRPTDERPVGCAAKRAPRSGPQVGAVPSGPSNEPPVQPAMIHPTIIQDMRAFEGNTPWEPYDSVERAALNGAGPSSLAGGSSNGLRGAGAGAGAGVGAADLTHFNLDFPSTAFPNPQQADFPLFPDFDFASPTGTTGTAGTPSSGAGGPSSSVAGGLGAPLAGMSPDPWTHPMQAALDPAPGVPVLDASWQAFVEQLGF
ncbi:fungal-specific transcription factor domain-containing protein [Trametes polyzona]|nr:fungal-specific transcription factor domain-containing protein [Trametes polyzona]